MKPVRRAVLVSRALALLPALGCQEAPEPDQRLDSGVDAAPVTVADSAGISIATIPNLHALNFVLPRALGGGGTVSLMMDAQGKVFSTALLRMEVEVPDETAQRTRGRGRIPEALYPNGKETHG